MKQLKAVSLYNLGSAFHTARLLLHFPPLLPAPAFSTPAFSTLAFLPVSHFPLPHFQSPHIYTYESVKTILCIAYDVV